MLRKLFIFIIAIVLVFTAFALISGRTYLFKAVMYNFANIDDYEKFINHTVKSGIAKPWKVATNYNKTALPDSLAGLMEDLSSVGLLLIKNDSIQSEKYWDGYSDSSLSGSFSMAKSITSLLIGVAIK